MHVESDHLLDYTTDSPPPPRYSEPSQPQNLTFLRAASVKTLDDPFGRIAQPQNISATVVSSPVGAPDYAPHTTPVLMPVTTITPAVRDTSGNVLTPPQSVTQNVVAPVPTQNFPVLNPDAPQYGTYSGNTPLYSSTKTPTVQTTTAGQSINVTTQSGFGEAVKTLSGMNPALIAGIIVVIVTIYLIFKK